MIVDSVYKLDEFINWCTSNPGRTYPSNLLMTDEIQRIYKAFTAAVEMDKNGNQLEAIRKNNEILFTEPEFVAPRYNLAYIHLQRKEFSQSLKHFQVASRINPNDPENFIKIGIIYSELGNKTAEIETYFQGLKFSPESIILTNNLGFTFFEIGDKQNSVKWLEKAVDLIEKKMVHGCSVDEESLYSNTMVWLASIYTDMGKLIERDNAIRRLQEPLGEKLKRIKNDQCRTNN